MTCTFIQFFFRNPKRVIEKLDENYLFSDACGQDSADVVFLHSERLNAELYNFLRSLRYKERSIAFIRNEAGQNVTRAREDKPWRAYYNKELFDFVKHRERFLFRLFPEYDEDY